MTLAQRLLVILASAIIAAAPLAPAFAQTYDDATIEAVNDHFARGEQYFYEEDYPNAIRQFEAANELIPNAIFLYNISVAYEKMGERDKALEKAKEADRMGGLGEREQTLNQGRIRAMQAAQTAEVAAAEMPLGPPPLFSFTKWGWIGSATAALGGLMLVNVLIVDSRLADEVDAYKEAAAVEDAAEYERLKAELRSRQTGARALFVVGTLALVGGVGLVIWDLRFNPDNPGVGRDVTVGVTPTLGGGAASVRYRF